MVRGEWWRCHQLGALSPFDRLVKVVLMIELEQVLKIDVDPLGLSALLELDHQIGDWPSVWVRIALLGSALPPFASCLARTPHASSMRLR